MKLKNLIIPVLFLVVIGGTSALLSLTRSGFFDTSSAMEPSSPTVTSVAKGDTLTVTVPAPAADKPLEIIIRHEQGSQNNSNQQSSQLIGIFWNVATVVVVVIGIYLLINFLRGRFGTGAPTGGGSPANHTSDKPFGQWINPESMGGNGFADVAGVPEAIRQMQKLGRKITEQADIVRKLRSEATKSGTGHRNVMASNGLMDKLRSMTKTSKFGGKVPQYVLLHGPPGTGKTLMVKALAKECNVPVFVVSGSDFVEVFVGLGAERIRRMFRDARYQRPCILFIDELDAVGKKRSSGPSSNEEADQTLNQFLAELQGLSSENENFALWIVGATNRIDILDPALLRPGRFTWHIKVDPPHLEGRVAILKLHANNRQVPLDETVDFKAIASVLPGQSGANLENIVNETALYAEELALEQARNLRARCVQAGRTLTEEQIETQVKSSVSQEDFFEGLLRHLMGVKLETTLRFDQTFNTVVHEAGHALTIAYERFLGRTDELVRFISVEPRDKALGLTFKTPEGDSFGKTLEHVDSDAVCAFGGSAAQLVFLNTKDSGPDNDFEVASGNIYRSIGRWYGSGKIGPVSLGQRGISNGTEMGPSLKDLIDSECIAKTKLLYARSWWIMNLFIRSESVWKMFWELLERKIMRGDRFAELFASAMQEVKSHPMWNNGELDVLLDTVKSDPLSWSPEPLNEETRSYLNARVEELRTRYAALCEAYKHNPTTNK